MWQHLSTYYLFRCKQAWRILLAIGWGHLIILMPILIVVVLGCLHAIRGSEGPYLALFVGFSLVGIHWQRWDRFFLEQLQIPLRFLYLVDYTLLSLPALIGFVYWYKWANLLAMGIIISGLAIVRPPYQHGQQKSWNNWLPLQYIPLNLFEWRSGFRKHWGWFFCLQLIGFLACTYPVTAFFVVFLQALLISSFFQVFESKDLLMAVQYQGNLLWIKVKASLISFNVLILPHFMLFVLLHQRWQMLTALFVIWVISQLLIAFSICMKYKAYNWYDTKLHNSLPLAIFVGCLSIPFLWPVPLLMLWRFWVGAQKNLWQHYA